MQQQHETINLEQWNQSLIRTAAALRTLRETIARRWEPAVEPVAVLAPAADYEGYEEWLDYTEASRLLTQQECEARSWEGWEVFGSDEIYSRATGYGISSEIGL